MSAGATLAAVSTLLDLTMAASHLIGKMQEVSAKLAQVQAEGRELTDEEWSAMFGADDEARLKLYAAIARSKAREG